jgi:catechol 2,3-dioxygenase-like lactoylglutathione lyase family enzyme
VADPAVDFYHALLYVADVPRSVDYFDRLGLEPVVEREGYARLRCPGGVGTLALHANGERSAQVPDVRLYLETPELDRYCAAARARGIDFVRPPQTMPWGWRHAYLVDPDGHELCVFTAGPQRRAGGEQ